MSLYHWRAHTKTHAHTRGHTHHIIYCQIHLYGYHINMDVQTAYLYHYLHLIGMCTYVCMYACVHLCMDGWTDKQTVDGCMHAWMDGRTNVWMYGCMLINVCLYVCVPVLSKKHIMHCYVYYVSKPQIARMTGFIYVPFSTWSFWWVHRRPHVRHT